MNWVEPSFFDNKVTVGVNEVYRKYDCDYLIRKESIGSEEMLKKANGIAQIVMSMGDCGNPNVPNPVYSDVIYFYHEQNGLIHIDFSVMDRDDHLIVSYSTITSAIHLAAYMGAKNIMICGHDCGMIDGGVNFKGYYLDPRTTDEDERYRKWLTEIEPQTRTVMDKIKEYYGCNIHSLNPFINLGMEGHKWESDVSNNKN